VECSLLHPLIRNDPIGDGDVNRRLAAAASLIALGATLAGSTSSRKPESEAFIEAGNHHRAPIFSVDGAPVRDLYPGKTKPMKLVVTNETDYKVRINQISAQVTAVSNRGCSIRSTSLKVVGYRGPLPVTVHRRSRSTIPGELIISMPKGASPSCAGARFTISIKPSITRVSR
jgi:hypothetical protein